MDNRMNNPNIDPDIPEHKMKTRKMKEKKVVNKLIDCGKLLIEKHSVLAKARCIYL